MQLGSLTLPKGSEAHGGDAEAAAGGDDAAGDLPAIGDEDLLEVLAAE